MYFKRIGDLRDYNNRTKKEIAEMLICNRQVYARYENGTREIPVSMLIKLAQYYGVSTDYLLEQTDEPKPYARRHSK